MIVTAPQKGLSMQDFLCAGPWSASSRTDPIQFRPEAAGERPSHEGGATTTAEVKAQGPPQSAGAVRGSDRTTDRQGGMVDVRPAKDGAHRPPQSAGAVRGRVSASRRPHTASRHLQPAPSTQPVSTMSMSTDNLQQQQPGQRQQQQQHLNFNQIESLPYPGISRSRRKWRH